jgi:citrate lyase beta subunit
MKVLNRAFTPDEAEINWAIRVFAAAEEAAKV